MEADTWDLGEDKKEGDSVELRYIPPDIREDTKIGKIVSIKALVITGIVLFIGIAVALTAYRNRPIMVIMVTGLPTLLTLIIMVLELPTWTRRIITYIKDQLQLKDLESRNHIEKYGAVCHLKNKEEAVFLEVTADPWGICPGDTREQRLQDFSEDVFSTVDEKGKVHINIQCTEDDTKDLERRYKKLYTYPEGLKELERDRIDHHYKLAKDARRFTYTVRVDHKKDKEKTIGDRTYMDGEYIGGAFIEDYINKHLTPDAPLERGEEDK